MKTISPELLKEAENIIPKGLYCYEIKDKDPITCKLLIQTCPFWDRSENYGRMDCGYCHLLKLGDWENDDYMTMLWDKIKECDINMGDDDES